VAAAGLTREEASEAVDVFMVYLGLGALHDLGLRNDHEVEEHVTLGAMAAEAFAKETLGAVAHNRGSHLPPDGQSQAMARSPVGGREELEQPPIHAPPGAEHPLELRR
jgi:hypothetical protein